MNEVAPDATDNECTIGQGSTGRGRGWTRLDVSQTLPSLPRCRMQSSQLPATRSSRGHDAIFLEKANMGRPMGRPWGRGRAQ